MSRKAKIVTTILMIGALCTIIIAAIIHKANHAIPQMLKVSSIEEGLEETIYCQKVKNSDNYIDIMAKLRANGQKAIIGSYPSIIYFEKDGKVCFIETKTFEEYVDSLLFVKYSSNTFLVKEAIPEYVFYH